MDPKPRQPVGKQPRTIEGRSLLLLACWFLLLRGVNSKTDIVGHRALFRFTGDEAPPAAALGLAAHPRIFAATAAEKIRTATSVRNEPRDKNNGTEEEAPATLRTTSEILGSLSASVEDGASQSHKGATATTDSGSLRSSPAPETSVLRSLDIAGSSALRSLDIAGSPASRSLDIAGSSASRSLDIAGSSASRSLDIAGSSASRSLDIAGSSASRSLDIAGSSASRSLDIAGSPASRSLDIAGSPASRSLDITGSSARQLLTPSLPVSGHRFLESSMVPLTEAQASTWTQRLAGETASFGQVISRSSTFMEPKSDAWQEKRDTFWSIRPTTVKPQEVSSTTGTTEDEVWSADISSRLEGRTELLAPTAASIFNHEPEVESVHEATTATVAFVSLTTERWSSEDVPSRPSPESQVANEEFSLPAGTVAGIVVASVGFVAIVAAVLGLLVFRRFRGLGPKSYDNKCNGDSCSYLDSLQVSYINNHIELPKESSEEMFSLDNDSFLNSLEAMTMENYWAEDRRSTRV